MRSEKEVIYDELLVLRCRRRDKAALEDLIRNWEKRLFYYIRRLVDNEQDAWDILQKTWLKVIRKIKSLKEPRSLPAWLYRIARNTAISHIRSEYSKRVFIKDAEEVPSNEKSNEEFRFEDAERVHYGLSKISLPHREALTLHFLDDLSIEEIAEVINVPPGTVKSRLHYAKRALRAVLEKEERGYE